MRRSRPFAAGVRTAHAAGRRASTRDRRGSVALQAAIAGRGLTPGEALQLQRLAGNRAVGGLVAPVTVQRHSSWEHALLGDTPPAQLGNAAVSREARGHVLSREWARMMFFRDDPGGDPRTQFPDVRWVQLKASGLWVSYGELNALADYLPDPTAYDTLDRAALVPVLQRMRAGIAAVTGAEFGLHTDRMAGMAEHWMPGAAGELKALDAATAGLGTNRYAGLVSRNACHFAPFSWERWSHFHNDARQEAIAHHAAKTAVAPVKDVDSSVEEHERQAILKNGYADHFLQDSFAAGHLVNKTLVMQWFVDYLNGLSWWVKPWFGLPDDDVMALMGSAAQPNIAGRGRYGRPPSSTVGATEDQWTGTSATDPQSAQERLGREHRMEGSGVVAAGGKSLEQNYQAYLRFLNSGFLQKAAGAAHDYFNERGLTVVNAAGTELRVGGDDTLLGKSNQVGAETAAQAASLSRQAIDELLATGQTAVTVDQIFQLVPQSVLAPAPGGGTSPVSIGDWQESVLKPLCFKVLFPELIETMSTNTVVRAFGAEMVAGGISIDAGVPPPPVGPAGDYPAPPEPAGAGSAYA